MSCARSWPARKRYPLVLMLEPLFRCNLACAGCGKIQYPAHILKTDLSPEDCFKAVDECGAPMVSIPGGEPLMHPADRRNCRRPGRPQEIYLSLHQRAAAQGKAAPVQAQQVSELLGPRRRTKRASRFLRLPRRRIRNRPRRNSRGRQGRLPRNHQHNSVRRRRSQERPRSSSTR